MKEPKRVLFISQEIYPYLAEESPIRVLNRKLPEVCQQSGYETRTFMPKFGEINERRNQLHEVIRLSGMNIIIDDTDHPLLLKVASIQSARIQIYFIDNDDFFKRRKGVVDDNGADYSDNDERCIFFARGVIETVKKLCWTPDIIYCSGWMSALAPLYLKKAYADTPFFANSKIVCSIYDQSFTTAFGTKFADKLLIDGVTPEDVSGIAGKKVSYADLMALAVQYSDAVIQASPVIDKKLEKYVKKTDKPFLPYAEDAAAASLDFFSKLLM
ncbi:MAG: glycogen/starch synthase [Bacteroides sp.]|nr:glycogen/starch synthase [Bacteroidales bacterium]MCM1068431.1 glycogen/starch synthase [Prevotella sp.]MCM1353386.1 glycogen/starch synthase [Bacteroides sp.]MCM1402819.1 glycogen/starch synthase [Bacteroides sp.]MCM1442547.1 glycogen/starch synthase [Muribaculum sp.]